MIDLMAYADGELEGEERARVEAMIASSDEAKRLVASMRALGDEVRAAHASGLPGLDAADSIADDVMAKIAGAPHAEAHAMGELVSLAAARRARTRATSVAVAIIALAAGVALWMHGRRRAARSPTARRTSRRRSRNLRRARPRRCPRPICRARLRAPRTGVDLEEVESPENHV